MRDPEPVQANISPEKVRLCQQVHDLQVEVLASFGIDACRHYQQNKVEHVLEAVQHDDVQCPLCHKGLASGAAIRSHIRSKHMDVTPFVCSKCDKTFGDNQQLRGHMKTHVDKDKFPCTHPGCTRGFPSLGRLNSHLKTHDPTQHVSCKHCGKVFNAKRNLAPHEKTCKQQPGGKKAAVKDKACLFCPKTFLPWQGFKISRRYCTQVMGREIVSHQQCLYLDEKRFSGARKCLSFYYKHSSDRSQRNFRPCFIPGLFFQKHSEALTFL